MPTAHLEITESALRIALAMVAGLVIGMEREAHGRAAGLRTTTLVCVAAAMAMIISEMLQSYGFGGRWGPDPARLGAGVLTGIGFLGAGSIIREEHIIRGVTTAATLWIVTVTGLAIGSGYYAVGFLGWTVALVALFVLPKIEAHLKQDWFAKLTIVAGLDGPAEEALRQAVHGFGANIQTVDLEIDLENRRRTVCYGIKLKRTSLLDLANRATAELSRQPGVKHVRWD